jgi:hypothetical protein
MNKNWKYDINNRFSFFNSIFSNKYFPFFPLNENKNKKYSNIKKRKLKINILRKIF